MNNIGPADLKLLKELYPNNYEQMLEKVKNHYPIQYLIGYVDFYNTKINVTEDVLIPRFETELLVDKTIKLLKNKKYHTLIDLCTGSGAIAISLKKNLKIDIDACDISNKALNIAKKNALENNTPINFFKCDILNDNLNKKYDCIISNPPYVKETEYTSPETKYEPQIALYAKKEGLEFYERILTLSKTSLNKNGTIIFEIGNTQKEAISKLATNLYPNAHITTIKDFNNYDRIMFIEL